MKKHSTVGDLVADLFAKYQNDFHNDAVAASVTRDVVHELRRFEPRGRSAAASPAHGRRISVTA